MKKSSGMILAVLLGVAGPVFADDSASLMSCVNEIKTVCAGMEGDLESCLSSRGSRLSDSCREQLKKTMSMTSSSTGLDACVNDIKLACPNVDAASLPQCIMSKKDSFSKLCLDYLQGAESTNK